ncbi:MAG: Flagellar protein FlaF [Roseomonas sp.]|nr:Flagellar protein FlaF [Roseomonas sp.]
MTPRDARACEAALFHALGLMLARVAGGGATRMEVSGAVSRLWRAVGAALAKPDCALPAGPRASLARLGQAVLGELEAASPDWTRLAAVHEQVAGALAPRH